MVPININTSEWFQLKSQPPVQCVPEVNVPEVHVLNRGREVAKSRS